jgi:hypothetical protein
MRPQSNVAISEAAPGTRDLFRVNAVAPELTTDPARDVRRLLVLSSPIRADAHERFGAT